MIRMKNLFLCLFCLSFLAPVTPRLQAQDYLKNITLEMEFLEENRDREGVHTTDSGLQYEIIKEGEGRSPKATDVVEVHYRGTTLSGSTFDSSYSRGQPAEFPVNRVIKGWTEALMMMKEGSKWKLYIPSKLAYGSAGSPPKIEPNSLLIFDVELISIK